MVQIEMNRAKINDLGMGTPIRGLNTHVNFCKSEHEAAAADDTSLSLDRQSNRHFGSHFDCGKFRAGTQPVQGLVRKKLQHLIARKVNVPRHGLSRGGRVVSVQFGEDFFMPDPAGNLLRTNRIEALHVT